MEIWDQGSVFSEAYHMKRQYSDVFQYVSNFGYSVKHMKYKYHQIKFIQQIKYIQSSEHNINQYLDIELKIIAYL